MMRNMLRRFDDAAYCLPSFRAGACGILRRFGLWQGFREIRNIEVVTRDFEAACRLVVGTNRIATVMSRIAQLCAENLPLRLIRPPCAIPKATHCLQWHRYQDQDPGHIWLRRLLKQTANRLHAPRNGVNAIRF